MVTKKIRFYATAKQRRNQLENELRIDLKNIAVFSFDEEKIKNKNCENLIGAVQIPLGIAGPLKIKNLQLKSKNLYLPLATTEGALVASVNRGCKAIFLSGGAAVFAEDIGATRGPVFRTSGIRQSLQFKKWLTDNFLLLKKEAEKTSSHLLLQKIGVRFCGKDVFVRFYFNTSEAMGMNMATIAADKIVALIEKKLKIKCLSLSGNFCLDKKPGWLNFISGRGKRVWAEARIKKEIVAKVLKTKTEKITAVVEKKCLLGSVMAGSLGFNGHYANIISALFLATGQDMAHVVEGSLGITTAEREENGDLYFSVYLPSLMLGTIGGGTHLETQKEALAILGLGKKEAGEALILAKIAAAAVLAGELSLIAALSSADLASAHQKLARGKND